MSNRLLIVNDFPLIGGAEQVLLQLCRRLLLENELRTIRQPDSDGNRRSLEFRVVTSRKDAFSNAVNRLGDMPIHFIDIQTLKQRWLSIPAWRRIRHELEMLCTEFPPDAILCNSLWSAVVVSRITPRSMPVLCAVHAAIAPKRWLKRMVFISAGSFLVRRLAGWITVSEELACQVRSLGIRPDRIDIIPNGVPIPESTAITRDGAFRTQHRISTDGIVALASGRIDPGKGQHILIEAFQRLITEGLDVYLVITGEEAVPAGGSAAYTRILQKMILANDLTGRIFLTGFVPGPAPLLMEADLVVSASREESFGLAVLEGMAAGRPVVASNVDGHRRLIADGVNGLLAGADDVDSYCNAVRKIATDSGYAKTLAEAARKTAMQYNLDDTMNCWMESIRQVIKRQSGTGNRPTRSGVQT